MAKHVNLSTMATRSHSSVGVSAVVSCQSDLALAWDASRPPSSASVRNASPLKKCPAKRSKIRANTPEGLHSSRTIQCQDYTPGVVATRTRTRFRREGTSCAHLWEFSQSCLSQAHPHQTSAPVTLQSTRHRPPTGAHAHTIATPDP